MKFLHPRTYLMAGLVFLCAAIIVALLMSSPRANPADAADATSSMLRREGNLLLVPERSALRQSLQVAAATTQSVAASFNLPASVEADPAKLVKILPPLSGRIVSINKRLGDTVKAGDVLLTIDSADLAAAQSDVGKAQAALALTRRNLERQRGLGEADIAARRDVEQAQSDYDQAASEMTRANARLSQLGAKGGNVTAAANGHLLSVRSPIAGRVVDLAAGVGGYWNDTTAAVMTVADLSSVFVTANAQEKDLGKIEVGQNVSVVLDAYPEPLKAKVRFVGEMLDPDTRTVKVRMLLDNRDGRLKPGMFAQAQFRARAHNGLLVPMSAVLQSGFYNRTFVETAPWQFEPRVVTLGVQVGDQVEVLTGLKDGDRVVVKEGVLLND